MPGNTPDSYVNPNLVQGIKNYVNNFLYEIAWNDFKNKPLTFTTISPELYSVETPSPKVTEMEVSVTAVTVWSMPPVATVTALISVPNPDPGIVISLFLVPWDVIDFKLCSCATNIYYKNVTWRLFMNHDKEFSSHNKYITI